MSLIESLEWRSSVKKFDPSKKLSQGDLDALVKAGNLTATSGGLQPFKLVVVENQELKDKMVPASYGQGQVGSASHVLVFAIEKDITPEIVDRYINRLAEVREVEASTMDGYKQSMGGWVGSMSDEVRYSWAKSQAYIALGTVMSVAAEMKIDSCPMEGFVPAQIDEILELDKLGLSAGLMLPVGYRSEEDVNSTLKKVRMRIEDFVIKM